MLTSCERSTHLKKANEGKALVNEIFANPIPTKEAGAESSTRVIENKTYAQWYRPMNTNIIFYRTTHSSTLANWSAPVPCKGVVGYFPTVFECLGRFYMFLNPVDYLKTKKVLLYVSNDGINWNILNNGNSVIKNVSSPTDWFRTIYNVGVCVIGSKIHIVAEGNADNGTFSDTAYLGYACADISNPAFTFSDKPILKGGNADLLYSAGHDALIMLYGHLPSYKETYWHFELATVNLSTDINKAESWRKSNLNFDILGNAADPDLVFTNGKMPTGIMFYNRDQSAQYRSDLKVTSVDELYNKAFKINRHQTQTKK